MKKPMSDEEKAILADAAKWALNGAVPMDEQGVIQAWNHLDVMGLMLDFEVRLHSVIAQGVDVCTDEGNEILMQVYAAASKKIGNQFGPMKVDLSSAMPSILDGANMHEELTKLRHDLVHRSDTGNPFSPEDKQFIACHYLWKGTQVSSFITALTDAITKLVFQSDIDKLAMRALLDKAWCTVSSALVTLRCSDGLPGDLFREKGLDFDRIYADAELAMSKQGEAQMPGQFAMLLNGLVTYSNWHMLPWPVFDEFLAELGEILNAGKGLQLPARPAGGEESLEDCSKCSIRDICPIRPAYEKMRQELQGNETQVVKIDPIPAKKEGSSFSLN